MTPYDMADKLWPSSYRRTPLLDVVFDTVELAVMNPGSLTVITCPPHEGKSSALLAAAAFSGARRDGRTALCGHHLRAFRHYIEGVPELAGVRTFTPGGVVLRPPIDVLFLDDVHLGFHDSPDSVQRICDWWVYECSAALLPGASVVHLTTRWFDGDLASKFIADGWGWVNVPALADGNAPDALGRPAGTWLQSRTGRSPADWEQVRANAGEDTFQRVFQGRRAA